ncbi:MAG: putative glycoside hydrolase [Clostridiales bacterium]|nr:putative glycoside hydrolase [Clostridiales bacterium]
MKRRKDMYIDYKRSYRNRRRRGNSKAFKIILTVILALAVGLAVFFAIKSQINFDNKEKSQKNELEEIDASDDISTENNSNHETPPLPTPTVTPTVTPIVEEVEENPVKERTPVKVKGIYVTSAKAGSEDMNRLIDIADNTEINAMVIDVKGDTGKISYHMNSPKAQEINATTNQISDMEALVRELKERDIYLIARIVAFKDPYLGEQKHELAIKNKDGSLYRDNNGECWVNPYKKEVWDYLIEVSTEAAAIGFDEIQFDYIRFSTGQGIAEADFGEEAETKTKEDIIIEFTKYAYEKLKPLGVFVSADVYGTIISSSIDAGLVGQNYVEMSKYLDYICPMIYPSHFGEGNYGIQYPDLEPLLIVRKVLNASKEKLSQIPEGEHRAIVRPWLQDFTASWIKHYQVYGGEEVRAQIDGVYEAGYEEWLLWNASTNYSVDGLLEE